MFKAFKAQFFFGDYKETALTKIQWLNWEKSLLYGDIAISFM